jgi:integrase
MTLPRYVIKVDNTYRYNPPSDAVKEGVVRRKTFGDYDDALAYASVSNTELDTWRRERKDLRNLNTNARVESLIKSYKQNISYLALVEKTRKDYDYYLQSWYDSKAAPMSKPLLQAKLDELTTPTCQRIYEEAAEQSVSLANHSLAVYRLLFNYAIRHGFTQHNPFSKVLRRADKPRRTVWTRADIKTFLDVAYSSFKWRNVGLIVQMAHEWGQRLGDMRLLTWDVYDIETGVLALEQSKRRAKVTLPTSQTLQTMLKQQHAEYGWQKYIAPSNTPDQQGGLKPFGDVRLAIVGAEIMKAAKLPEDLRLMDLRRTAISEMLEVGVPITNIMSISGHATPQSLTPYLKHTLQSATLAQNMRQPL